MDAAWGNYTAVGGLGFRHSWVALAMYRLGTTGASANPFLNMPIAQLVEEKRRLEEAWRVARAVVRGALVPRRIARPSIGRSTRAG